MENLKLEQLSKDELLTINGGSTPLIDFNLGKIIGKILARLFKGLFQ